MASSKLSKKLQNGICNTDSPPATVARASPTISSKTLIFENAKTGRMCRLRTTEKGSDNETLLDAAIAKAPVLHDCALSEEDMQHMSGICYSETCVTVLESHNEDYIREHIESMDPLLCELVALDQKLELNYADLFHPEGQTQIIAKEAINSLKRINQNKQKLGPVSLTDYCFQLASFLKSVPTSSSRGHCPVPCTTPKLLRQLYQEYQDMLKACIEELISECKEQHGVYGGVKATIPRFSVSNSIGPFPEYALRRNGAAAIYSMIDPLMSELPVSPQKQSQGGKCKKTDNDSNKPCTDDARGVISHLRSAHDLLTLIDYISQYRCHCFMAHYLLCHHTWLGLKRKRIEKAAKFLRVKSSNSTDVQISKTCPGAGDRRCVTVGTWNMAHINAEADMQRVCPGRIEVFKEELIHRMSSTYPDSPVCMAVCIQECSSRHTLEIMTRGTPYAIVMNVDMELPILYDSNQWDCTMSDYRTPKECGLIHGLHIAKFRHRQESAVSVPALASAGSVVSGHEITLVNAHLTPGSKAKNIDETKLLQDVLVTESESNPKSVILGLMDANVCAASYDHRNRWFDESVHDGEFLKTFKTHGDQNLGTSLLDTCASRCSRGTKPRLYDIVISNRVKNLSVSNVKAGFCIGEHRAAYCCKKNCHSSIPRALAEDDVLENIDLRTVVFGNHQPLFCKVDLP